jgi:hypothetical protein
MNKFEEGVREFVRKCQAGKRQSPLIAARQKCLDCCCYQYAEVEKCPANDCPLWFFRKGKNESGKIIPSGKKWTLTSR